MAAKDVLGRRGEDLAARVPASSRVWWSCPATGGAGTASSTWSPPTPTGSWSARSRPAPAPGSGHRPRRSTGARRPGSGGSPRPGWPPTRCAGARSGSTCSPCVAEPGAAGHRAALPGGVLMGARAGVVGGPARGRRPRRWRSRPTSAAGCRGSTWSGCPTRRCTRRRTGCGPRSSTPGAAGPTSGSCWRCRPATPAQGRQRLRPGAGRAASSAAGGVVDAGRAGRHACCSASWPWTAGCGRCAGCCRACSPRGRPGMRRAVVPDGGARRGGAGRRASRCSAPASLAEVLGFLPGDRAAARGRARSTTAAARRRPTSPTSSGRTTPGRRWRSPRPAGTTCCWSGRPAPARRCSPSGSSGCCPGSTRDEALALAAIRSVAGRLPRGGALSTVPPFVAPHHSSSMAALVGGGSGLARPGRGVAGPPRRAVPRRGPGVRRRSLLDALRTPLEEGEVRLARAEGTVLLPGPVPAACSRPTRARARPPTTATACARRSVRRRYLGRLSGPLLDRVDLRARMFPVTALSAADAATRRARPPCGRGCWPPGPPRPSGGPGRAGGPTPRCPGPVLRTRFALPRGAVRAARRRPARAASSPRAGADRALRVAWTLADLAGRDRPDRELVETALFFRDRRAA